MEAPLHPTPMQRPMMKGKIYVDASNKPTFQGIWGMTHADVNKSGHTNDFKVVRMESVKEHELGLPVFSGHYLGYFKLTTGFQTETVNESFTLTFRGHTNHGYNVYGFGENRYGKNEIVGTVTQTGKMEIFKMIPGTTVQPDPNEPAPPLPRPTNPRAVSPPPPTLGRPFAPTPKGGFGGGGGGAKPKAGGSTKKKTPKKPTTQPPPSKNGLPGAHVRTLKDGLIMLRKSDKNGVFQFPVPSNFRGLRGVYSDVIKNPMDLGTVFKQIDSKYRTARDCIADVRLVFSNAKEFNPDTDPVNALAASLSGKFEAFVANHRGILGLDGKAPTPPSMALSTSAGANTTGKRISTPPPPTTAVVNTNSGGGGGGGGGTTKEPVAAVEVLTVEEQDKLARDVNELFRVGNANPSNERAQSRVYALWSFAKTYVEDKDRVSVDGGKSSEIRMDALNHVRQRQLRDIVSFFMEDSKNDPVVATPANGREQTSSTPTAATTSSSSSSSKVKPEGNKNSSGEGDRGDGPSGGRPGKRPRSDLSDSDKDEEDQDEEDEEDRDDPQERSPAKRSRDGSVASPGSKGASSRDGAPSVEEKAKAADSSPTRGAAFGRVDSSALTLEATASTLKEAEIDIDLDEDEEDEEDEGGGGGGPGGAGSGGEGGARDGSKRDEQWLQAQAERKEREEREKARAASEKALEEQRLKQQAQREKERVEEGLRLSRERAAEKARAEAAALEKLNREKKELEDKKEAERLAREGTKASVDLDQVRADSNLMELMDESIYDD